MASEAHGNVQKAMDAAREAEIAAYIMRDVDLRQQNAQGILTTVSYKVLMFVKDCLNTKGLK